MRRRRQSSYAWCFSILFLVAIAGCEQPAPGTAGNADDADTKPADATSAASGGGSDAPAAAKIDVQVVDRAGYDAVIARHKGKVVLVDFWATWCVPCTAQFPHTVELSKKYADSGLAVVSVSLDSPDAKDEALAFLQKQQAEFDNLLSKYDSQGSAKQFELESGGVPHYKLYDRTGKLRYVFSDQLDLSDTVKRTEKIDDGIKGLLAEQPS